jgi:hypothetical protein
MAQDLSTFNNLIPNVAENYFNDQEQGIVDYIKVNGSGYYKLTQLKTGAFVNVEKVTEIVEDDFIVYGGLLCVIGSDDVDWHYGYFIPTNP